jgi:hypothetical protein
MLKNHYRSQISLVATERDFGSGTCICTQFEQERSATQILTLLWLVQVVEHSGRRAFPSSSIQVVEHSGRPW